VALATGYPGTPSTEILEHFAALEGRRGYMRLSLTVPRETIVRSHCCPAIASGATDNLNGIKRMSVLRRFFDLKFQ